MMVMITSTKPNLTTVNNAKFYSPKIDRKSEEIPLMGRLGWLVVARSETALKFLKASGREGA